jgi:dTDP-4-dehydrorhamnose reductase
MKVAVVGANGQLGAQLIRVLSETPGAEPIPFTHAQIEVTDARGVRAALLPTRADAVVNCAAFHRVDDCEERPEVAFATNALGALHVARACAELGALCVFISSDYVFDGERGRPYVEEDVPAPLNVYGTSKAAGERLVAQACPRWLVARVAGLFGGTGASGKGGNFVTAILAQAAAGAPLRVVNDLRMSPTYALDAARALALLIAQGAAGTVHLTNAGNCTWWEFATRILALAGRTAPVEPVPSSAVFSSRARRPKDSSLASRRLSGEARRCLRPWQEAVAAYLQERGVLAAGKAAGA